MHGLLAHTYADTPITHTHMQAEMDIAWTWRPHTHTHIYLTHAHTSTPGHLHSHIIEPIKEMSLISRGVRVLVNHWGFLAGVGDMQSSPSSLWDLSHHALIRHSSKLYWDSWFSRAGLAQKCVRSSAGHLWTSFKGFLKNGSVRNVGGHTFTSQGLHVFRVSPHLTENQ